MREDLFEGMDCTQETAQFFTAELIKRGELQKLIQGMRDDKEFFRKSVQTDMGTLAHASLELRSNKEFMTEMVAVSPSAFEHATNGLREDKDLALAAISQDGNMLHYASHSLASDKELVLVAVKNNGMALQYASDGPINDKEIVRAAIDSHPMSLGFASKEVLEDRGIVLEALKAGEAKHSFGVRTVFARLCDEMKDDREIVMSAVKCNGWVLRGVSKRLRDDAEILFEAYKGTEDIDFVLEHSSLRIKVLIDNQITADSPEGTDIQILEKLASHEKLQHSLSQKVSAPKQVRGLKI